MRSILIFLFCLVCFPSYASNIKIGFIDTNQVVTSLTKYRQSVDLISLEFEPKKQELLALSKHIELLRSNIESLKKSNSSSSIDEELLKLANLELSFTEETEIWQKTLNNEKLKLLNQIEKIVNQAISDYAAKEEFDLILYENVAFVSDKVNITEEIIEKIENQGL